MRSGVSQIPLEMITITTNDANSIS